ncbi:unnamed protein product [Peronospora farinosa]|uniref:GAG-pre-integrase domain-containing protein n=1 Tax=Peronospora farinosa TaxID=134698 RepID=A0AAV0STF7_9STRA|nr:unnamed protein product [Peronospora farinosa]CAI5706670.1 unnamed protein product [Peronospora farinosa]
MERLETSQERKKEKERLKEHEVSVFGSSLGLGQAMRRQALDMTPPANKSPAPSPTTYFGMRQPNYVNAAANVEMAQAPQQTLPQNCIDQCHSSRCIHRTHTWPECRTHASESVLCDKYILLRGQAVSVDQGRQSRHFGPSPERYGRKVLQSAGGRLVGRAADSGARYSAAAAHVATKITPDQIMTRFTALKSLKRSWTDLYLYLVAVSEACGGADNLFQDNISTEIELRGKQLGKDVVNNVENVARDTSKSFKCGKAGYLKAACTSSKKKWNGDADFVLTIKESGLDYGLCILDSGSSRHLVNDVGLLEDAKDFASECIAADGGSLKIKAKGHGIAYSVCHRVVAAMDGEPAVFDVMKSKNVLAVRACGHSHTGKAGDILISVSQYEQEVKEDVQRGSHMHFHRRLGHLHYDTILQMAKNPASGIALTDEV